MNNPPVTLVTQNATADELPESLYLDILRSLVEVDKMSFQQLADATSHASKAWWNLRYHGKRPIDEEGKNALRKLSEEFPPQPPSVSSVTERMIHPDAAMWLVGTLDDGEQVRRVVMVAEDGPVTINANGTVTAERTGAVLSDFDIDMDGSVNLNVGEQEPRRYTRNNGSQRPSYRPRLPLTLKERIEADGRTVEQLIEAALNAKENDE
jgi:hypothetical protein